MDLKQRRLEKNWSQEQLAEITGVSSRTIQRIENGAKPGLETMKALAAGLELTVSELQQASAGNEEEGAQATPASASSPRAWRNFVLNLLLFMVAETWVLVLAQFFPVDPQLAGVVAFLWGGILMFHLIKVIRKNP